LNGRVRGAATPAADATPVATNRLSPEVFEPVRGELGVAHRVLDVFVAEPRLQRPGVVAGVGERIAAAMPQHVRMYRELHLGPRPDPSGDLGIAINRST